MLLDICIHETYLKIKLIYYLLVRRFELTLKKKMVKNEVFVDQQTFKLTFINNNFINNISLLIICMLSFKGKF